MYDGRSADFSRDQALARVATARIEGQVGLTLDVLSAAEVPAIVLKGPVTRHRLYDAAELRPVADIDLLVPGDRHRRAGAALRSAGYQPGPSVGHASTWTSPNGIPIDLHLSLPWVTVSPRRAYRILDAHRTTLRIGNRDLPVLDEPAHLVHLAVHAAQNASDPSSRAHDELRRGLAALDPAQVERATALAGRLGLTPVYEGACAALDDPQVRARLLDDLPPRSIQRGRLIEFAIARGSRRQRARSARRSIERRWARRMGQLGRTGSSDRE